MWIGEQGLNVVCEHGAFELCLPSLGFFITKLTLRTQLLGQRHRMIKVGVGGRAWRVGTLCRDHLGLVFTKFTSGAGLRPGLVAHGADEIV